MRYTVKLLQPLKLPNGSFALTSYVGIHEDAFTEGYIPDDYIEVKHGDIISILDKKEVVIR